MRMSDWSSDVCSSDLIRPGDQLFQERRFHDYKVADTKFAGPTVFQRGDTLHRNQHGTPVAKSRSTTIRYLAAEAEKRKMYADKLPPKPKWTAEKIAEVDQVRHDWILSNREGVPPAIQSVKNGRASWRERVGR